MFGAGLVFIARNNSALRDTLGIPNIITRLTRTRRLNSSGRRFKDFRASVDRTVRIGWHSSCTEESVVSLSCELEMRYDHHHQAKELEDIK